MARIIFPQGEQSEWIKKILEDNSSSVNEIAHICNVSTRTVRDWRREKNTISKDALLKLSQQYNVKIPSEIKEVPDYWYVLKGARSGALKRIELYGPPGTPEGRKKGGINSQINRRKDPEKYKLLGCNISKEFNFNKKHSVDLAEAVGIILGDGGITKDQLRVTVSSIVDRPYAEFIRLLFERAFGDKPTWHELINSNAILLINSGSKLIEELGKWGLLKGNKIKNKISFPPWIWDKIEYQKACVRGLMDTDGGCYFHTHKSNGLTYKNFGICFTNNSLPILFSVSTVLKSLGLKFTLVKGKIYLYDFEVIKKYFNIIGSHNPKNNEKFQYYLNQKSHRVLSE